MPAVRSVKISDNVIEIDDFRGVKKTLKASSIPSSQNTIAKIENYINNTWIPANITEYQASVHVFSINPLRTTVGTWELGESIPANWWDL